MGIEPTNQLVILLGCGFDFISEAGAIVCRPDELAPIPTRCLPRGSVRGKFLHVLTPVSISKIGGDLTVSIDGDIFGLRDGIEIGNEWNGNPVIPPNSVVPADHPPGGPRDAKPLG